MNFEKGMSIKHSIFLRKMSRPSSKLGKLLCRIGTFWWEINILKVSTSKIVTSVNYRSEKQKSRSLRKSGQFLKQLFATFSLKIDHFSRKKKDGAL